MLSQGAMKRKGGAGISSTPRLRKNAQRGFTPSSFTVRILLLFIMFLWVGTSILVIVYNKGDGVSNGQPKDELMDTKAISPLKIAKSFKIKNALKDRWEKAGNKLRGGGTNVIRNNMNLTVNGHHHLPKVANPGPPIEKHLDDLDKSSPEEGLQEQEITAEMSALAAVHHSTGAIPASDAHRKMIDMRRLNAELKFDDPDGGVWKQGWDVEPVHVDANNPLTIFVVPHSHCDPGWIKTFDQYFQSQTRSILTTVFNALMKDTRRKFIWAEISYFEWWWREQTEQVQEKMKDLIDNKQFEFVTAGWVQPDEANTQRYAIEVQLQEGHDWLRKTFGEEVIPKYGWSIDPFGYSPTMADILHKYGFKAMLIQRVHYAIKKELAKRKHLEFSWRQTWDTAGTHDIFTHVMPFYSYDVPHTCGPDPSICCQFDFARLNYGYNGCPWHKAPQEINSRNVKERAYLLLDQYKKKAALYQSRVVIAPLGDDFRYQSSMEAENQYNNYQKIFDYLNHNVPGVEIRFGTLSDYFEKVLGSFEPPLLKGSFFTYSDREQDYWSGYFTSRIFDKALDRKLERTLFAATSMGASKDEMQGPRRALSLFQHHDGVTGTAKNHVVEDYAKQIHTSINSVQDWMVEKIKERHQEATSIGACWKSDAPRGLSQNMCVEDEPIYLYNPLATEQFCGEVVVPSESVVRASLPCEQPGPKLSGAISEIKFDSNGMMTHPIKEEWNVWKVQRGGAYLFFPGKYVSYLYDKKDITIEKDGFVVSTPFWKRSVVEKKVPTELGTAIVIDFIFETHLQTDNEEWVVRLSAPISNNGVFHTDLNGFNFDTHYFREDLPIQSQVFPMPTLASIEDSTQRMTILSEHAQGTASLKDGTIDVWLDRRLRQDDERGLAQGVRDNVPTRTRLRAVVESGAYDNNDSAEFEITPVCKRMWDELNHPLEMFGYYSSNGGNNEVREKPKFPQLTPVNANGIQQKDTVNQSIVPFVYMVHDRVDYLRRAIETLRNSDFPKSTVPLVISHDGHVPDVVSLVDSLKNEFNIIQLFHPHACFDHPNSFPGDDISLNENYKGDSYGNMRSGWATCAKHHWSWMMKTVWDMQFDGKKVDAMFFLEEDYIVSPSIYSTINTGLQLVADSSSPNKYFGLILDATNANADKVDEKLDGWIEKAFRTGPMVMQRGTWDKIVSSKEIFCTYDEYNWDWSIVHLQVQGSVPCFVLAPSAPQVRHIGVVGMHGGANEEAKKKAATADTPSEFHGKSIVSRQNTTPIIARKNGGWAHPKDHQHCLEVLGSK